MLAADCRCQGEKKFRGPATITPFQQMNTLHVVESSDIQQLQPGQLAGGLKILLHAEAKPHVDAIAVVRAERNRRQLERRRPGDQGLQRVRHHR